MPPKPIPPLVDRVFDGIFTLIQSGEIPLGGTLNEVVLAARFDVSRGPVREAIKRLQGLGLVTKEPYLRARLVQLSPRDLIDIFQLREAVEATATRLATEAMSDNELEALWSDFSQSRQDPDSRVLDLHIRIAEGCGNERIRKLLCEELYHLLRIYRLRSGALPGRHHEASEEHWQILRAMRSRDGELAASLMRSHIRRATATLLAELQTEAATEPVTAGEATCRHAEPGRINS